MKFLPVLQSVLCFVFFYIPTQTLISQSALDSIKAMVNNSSYSDSLRADKADRLSAYYIGRDIDSAIYYNSRASKLIANANADELAVSIELSKLDIHRHKWNIDTLDLLYEKVIKDADEAGYDRIQLKALISHSALFSNQGQGEKGIKILLKAVPIAERLEAYSELGKIQYNMAAIYSNMGMSELSNERLKEAYSSFKKAEQTEFSLFTLNAIANNYNNSEEYDSAIYYLNLVMPGVDSLNYTKLQVGARSTLGAIHLSQKRYEDAKEIFEEAIPFAEKMGSDLTLANCYCNLGRSNYHLKNYKEAKKQLEQAYSYPVFKNNLLANQYCLKEMAMVQKELGNYQKSSEFFEAYVHYQDTVLIKENKLIVTELEEKYENSKKEAEILAQDAEISRKTYERNMLFGGLGLSVLLSSSFIWGLVSRNKRNKKIADQELELNSQKIESLEQEKKLLGMSSLLEGQENERIRIAKDLHDGLGGLLSTVKAHFSKIQSEIEQIESLDIYTSANKMIDKAHDEVRRISHNLMPADLRAGGLPIAIRQLVHELRSVHAIKTDFETMGFQDDRFEDKIELTVYRIIQELINNMVKYAQAKQAFIQLSKFDQELQIVVEDDGVGFNFHEELGSNKGIGLRSILTRVESLQGNIDIDSSSGKGTSVTINIPIIS